MLSLINSGAKNAPLIFCAFRWAFSLERLQLQRLTKLLHEFRAGHGQGAPAHLTQQKIAGGRIARVQRGGDQIGVVGHIQTVPHFRS